MNLTIRHYCESKVLNQNISTKHDMIYSYNAVYQIPRPRDTCPFYELVDNSQFLKQVIHIFETKGGLEPTFRNTLNLKMLISRNQNLALGGLRPTACPCE